GPGMVATAFAGYPAPCLLGLGAAMLAVTEWYLAALVIGVLLLAGMLLAVRNLFGVLALVLTGAALVALVLYAPDDVQRVGVSVLAWFLLFGGLRSVGELHRERRDLRVRTTDADLLARLTRVPAIVWVALFGLVGLGSLAGAVRLLFQA